MTDLKTQGAELRAKIETAFTDVPYPGDDNLAAGPQKDDDYDDVITNLRRKHWRDLIPKEPPPQGWANPITKDMFFCTAEAWRFLLPAYLIINIMRNEIDAKLLDPATAREERFVLLHAEQCVAIAAYLDYGIALLEETQENTPHRSMYFEKSKQKLALLIAYWETRAEIIARAETVKFEKEL